MQRAMHAYLVGYLQLLQILDWSCYQINERCSSSQEFYVEEDVNG